MLKYAVIMLDSSSVSFCSYDNGKNNHPISVDDLSCAITWTMKENLEVQFLYPDYDLGNEIDNIIDSISHIKVMNHNHPLSTKADIVVVNGIADMQTVKWEQLKNIVVKISYNELGDALSFISSATMNLNRINFVFPDRNQFVDSDIPSYKDSLIELKNLLIKHAETTQSLVQTNLLTDRLLLTEMNNCNAGIESITIAPNGQFYICPAFYQNGRGKACGTIYDGLSIENQHLFDIKHAPICSHCDAYQCHRCVWHNKISTLEVNTPSRGQCVSSHIERQVSNLLLKDLKKLEIKIDGLIDNLNDINYIDPLDNRKIWY